MEGWDGADSNSGSGLAKLVSRIRVATKEEAKDPSPLDRGSLGWGRGQGRLCRTPG